MSRRDEYAAVLAAHRRNEVDEPGGGLPPHHWRVKCDSKTCDFYAEAPRWWDVCALHEAHLADVLAAALPGPEQAVREAQAVLNFLRGWSNAGTPLPPVGLIASTIREARP